MANLNRDNADARRCVSIYDVTEGEIVLVQIRCFGFRREGGLYRNRLRWRLAKVRWIGSVGNTCGFGVTLLRKPRYWNSAREFISRNATRIRKPLTKTE